MKTIFENDQLTKSSRVGYAALVMLWSLLPGPAIWCGLHFFKSAAVSYALYHGIALIGIVLGYSLWKDGIRKPSIKQALFLVAATIVFSIAAVFLYRHFGPYLFSKTRAIYVMSEQGWCRELFWPISLYAIIINPIVEELFWRGVVLNALDKLAAPLKWLGIVWSSSAFGLLHYSIARMVVRPEIAFMFIFCLAAFGAILSTIYRKTQSLTLITLIHSLLPDLAAVVLMLQIMP